MREKKDSIFNSDILNQTAHLTREEFGILITIAMIEDDSETNKRYENISDIFLKSYIEKEKEWKEQFNKIIENPILLSAYNTIYGSAKKSRNGYNKLKDKLDKEKNEDEEEIANNNTFTSSFIFGTKNIVIKYTNKTIENIPEREDIEDMKNNVNEEILIKMLEIGNKEKWKRHYEDILSELQTEEQLKEESPFDCLESEDKK